ncbi:MAG TPA: cytochrome c oxidase assembly protein [Amycolatopsis sp.]|nr:cytochrome c oxidase assembly protein [Amycolatopsis sp.]
MTDELVRQRSSVPACLAGSVVLALGVVVALALWGGDEFYTQVGNADPGLVVSVGAPVLRLVADGASVVCTGSLFFVVLCTRPAESGLLSASGYAELRWAAGSAWVWLGAAVLLVPFSAADTGGLPLSAAVANLPGLMGALEQPKAWAGTAVLVAVLALGARSTLRWAPAAGWCALALVAVLPPLMTAHGSSDTGHDLSLAAFVTHVPAAMVWFGLLLALLRRAATGSAGLIRRYDRVASWCWLALAASGVVLGAVLVPPGQVFTSFYGLVLLVKVVLAVTAGVAGRVGARRVARRIADRPGRRSLAVYFGTELVLLGAVLGCSVGLSHLPLPDFLGRVLDTTETLLGYDLPGPPTLVRLAFDWRVDVVFAPLAVVLLGSYLLAVRRLGGGWPWLRTAAWVAGCVVMVLATSSGIGRYAGAMFSVHQASHMLLTMLVPALLALGGPLGLASAAYGTGGGLLPGSSELLHRIAGTRLVAALTHPIVVLGLFAGTPFLLYFTDLFDAIVRFHWGHLLINAWFLSVGYLFFWVVVGPDPAPRPMPGIARLGLLLAAMPADVVFGAFLMTTGRIVGNGPASSNMYQALALPWVPDLAADQRVAGLIALVVGELTLAVALVGLLTRWNRDDATGFAGYERLARDVREHRDSLGAGPR